MSNYCRKELFHKNNKRTSEMFNYKTSLRFLCSSMCNLLFDFKRRGRKDVTKKIQSL